MQTAFSRFQLVRNIAIGVVTAGTVVSPSVWRMARPGYDVPKHPR